MTIEKNTCFEVFKAGTTWMRADFHLHTHQDNEFSYSGNSFEHDYIDGLLNARINIGVITNHNNFNGHEYKKLRKAGLKNEIFLLPGVELSVKDGSNGIHTLIVFSDEWILNQENKDYINNFISLCFAGQTNSDKDNARSNFDLIETIRKLDTYCKDYFIIFAHVEKDNGLWGGLSGGRLKDLGADKLFRQRTLGFQKVRTHDVSGRACRKSVKSWFKDWYPAEVEGSDCKSIDEIGNGEISYLKIGNFSFEAVKFALLDHQNRVTKKIVTYNHSHISQISFEGGVLDGTTICLSPGLNSLIGIRGSGKSTVLEALRYVMDIPFGEKALDTEYKNKLIGHSIGSGGKVIINAIDRRGQEYTISRILNEQPDIYVNGTLQPGISLRETIMYKPIYFGQKDLSSTGEGFEKDLVEKLVGEKLVKIRRQIDDQRQKVAEEIKHFLGFSNLKDKKNEYESRKQDAEFKLKFYKKYGVEVKLQKQVDFDKDIRKCGSIEFSVKEYLEDLEGIIITHEDELKNHRLYKSNQNKPFFKKFFIIFDAILKNFDVVKKILNDSKQELSKLNKKTIDIESLRAGLKEEFAKIERKLSEELKEEGIQAIRPDEFLKLTKKVEQAKQMLQAIENQQLQHKNVTSALMTELSVLNDLWHQEFNDIKTELEKVNNQNSSLQIRVEYKGDKATFISDMQDVFRGSRIRETTFRSIAENFSDFGAMFKNWQLVKDITNTSEPILKEYFYNNIEALLTWQIPNQFAIEYRGKELKHHSLGQRASALIIFVLSQRDNDLIIIDQPEDDLDNQTIYEDVIKLVRDLKSETQFVFATHNANFPVLGDSEQIFSCHYEDEKMSIISGSIDRAELQQEIVNIMEGGEEAFKRRKEIYKIWKPQSY